jgi:hypothetical protein
MYPAAKVKKKLQASTSVRWSLLDKAGGLYERRRLRASFLELRIESGASAL